jgi:hypothetical protein
MMLEREGMRRWLSALSLVLISVWTSTRKPEV